MMRLSKFIVCGIFIGCSYSEPFVTDNISVPMEIISFYDYKYYSGHNAAVEQFGQQYPDLFINMDNKKIVNYSSESSNNGYAEGYHKAIEIIDSRRNFQCPHFH